MVLFLILSIIFNTGFAMSYKIATRRNSNVQAVNVWMYIGSTLTVITYILIKHELSLNIQAIILGSISGFMVFFATLAFFYHIGYGQLSASWTVISLAIAFPVLASIFVWHEQPNQKQIAGLVLITFALILFGRHETRNGGTS